MVIAVRVALQQLAQPRARALEVARVVHDDVEARVARARAGTRRSARCARPCSSRSPTGRCRTRGSSAARGRPARRSPRPAPRPCRASRRGACRGRLPQASAGVEVSIAVPVDEGARAPRRRSAAASRGGQRAPSASCRARRAPSAGHGSAVAVDEQIDRHRRAIACARSRRSAVLRRRGAGTRARTAARRAARRTRAASAPTAQQPRKRATVGVVPADAAQQPRALRAASRRRCAPARGRRRDPDRRSGPAGRRGRAGNRGTPCASSLRAGARKPIEYVVQASTATPSCAYVRRQVEHVARRRAPRRARARSGAGS